jgi:hypothetical protein
MSAQHSAQFAPTDNKWVEKERSHRLELLPPKSAEMGGERQQRVGWEMKVSQVGASSSKIYMRSEVSDSSEWIGKLYTN